MLFKESCAVFCTLICAVATQAQVQGPIYELLDQYRQAMTIDQADPSTWAQRIADALHQNPDEEWSTRMRAYEELGSIYWRADQYEDAAPIFLELWQEADARGDSGAAVTSLDHLINLYDEAGFPADDVLALYDATEAWLRDPPPGNEEQYAKLLLELYGERAAREENYARRAMDGSADQRAHFAQAEYFAALAAQARGVEHNTNGTLAQLARAWFAKRDARHAAKATADAPQPESAPEAPMESPVPTSTTSTPAMPVPAMPAPTPPATLNPVATETPVPVSTGIPTEWVVLGCLAVIIVGWGLAGYLYLRKQRG